MNQTFKDILTQKLELNDRPSPLFSMTSTPEYLEFHALNLIFSFKTQMRNQYKSVAKQPTPERILSFEQAEALNSINIYLTGQTILPSGFSAISLKKAFRKAALKAHPDRGGSELEFIQLKKAYQLLMDSLDLSSAIK